MVVGKGLLNMLEKADDLSSGNDRQFTDLFRPNICSRLLDYNDTYGICYSYSPSDVRNNIGCYPKVS